MRQLNVPTGMQRVSVVVLLGSGTDRAWHSKLNRRNLGLSLQHTLPRLAGNDLANHRVFSCEPQREGDIDTSGVTEMISTSNKNIVKPFNFHNAVCVRGWEKPERRRKRREEEEEQEWPVVFPVVIWQVMRGGALLIYPHREKTVLLIPLTPRPFFPLLLLFLSIHPSLQEHLSFCGGKVVLFIYLLFASIYVESIHLSSQHLAKDF